MLIKTFTGGLLDLENPKPEDIDLRDIIWPLCKINRFGGHIKNRKIGRLPVEALHYSVAEHSILLAHRLMTDYPHRPMLALQGLMHDAGEAYIGDIISPIKGNRAVSRVLKAIERQLETAIFEKCAIDYPLDPIIKNYDMRILMDEQSQALNRGDGDFDTGEPLGVILQFWTPEQAHEQFFHMYGKLKAAAMEDLPEAA